MALAALGLVLSGISTFAALGDWTSQRDERTLSAIGRQAGDVIGQGYLETGASSGAPSTAGAPSTSGAPGAPATTRPDDTTLLWRSVAERGGIPSFFQIRDASGKVLQTVNYGTLPRLPADLAPGRISRDNPNGERFHKIDGMREKWNFRIRTAWLPDRKRLLVIGMQTHESDELGPRAAGSMLIFGLAALAGVALLAGLATKRGLRPLDDIGTTASAIGAGDLTRRVTPVDPRTEVGRLGRALNGMLGQIEAAFREREAAEGRLRRFVADASHELRTPVATIRGYAELFRRGAAQRPEDLRKSMARIESEAERMGELVDELLLLARLDQGRALEREPVDVNEIAADTIADALAVEPERPLSLEGDDPVIVTGDEARLRQVLANLLSNVRQHTPPETPAVVRLGRDSGTAVIEVEDQGPGLTEEQRAHALERFYRADTSRSRPSGGAGLGLSIVEAVVTAHGGDVTLESAPGAGTLVRIRLPLSAG